MYIFIVSYDPRETSTNDVDTDYTDIHISDEF